MIEIWRSSLGGIFYFLYVCMYVTKYWKNRWELLEQICTSDDCYSISYKDFQINALDFKRCTRIVKKKSMHWITEAQAGNMISSNVNTYLQ